MYTSTWENDSKPQSPQKACGLAIINPQNIPRIFLLIAAIANVAMLLNGAFYSIDTDGPVQFWACSLRGDFFNVCLNGMIISVASIEFAFLFTLKDCIMCAVNSLSWTRWMQLTEGVVFLLLSVWWVVSAALHHAVFRDLVASNVTSSVPGVSPMSFAKSVSPSIGLEYALLGFSIGCVISNVMWLVFERCICTRVQK